MAECCICYEKHYITRTNCKHCICVNCLMGYMEDILSVFGKNVYAKLFGGFLVIYFLEICIHSFICIYDKYVEKEKH